MPGTYDEIRQKSRQFEIGEVARASLDATSPADLGRGSDPRTHLQHRMHQPPQRVMKCHNQARMHGGSGHGVPVAMV